MGILIYIVIKCRNFRSHWRVSHTQLGNLVLHNLFYLQLLLYIKLNTQFQNEILKRETIELFTNHLPLVLNWIHLIIRLIALSSNPSAIYHRVSFYFGVNNNRPKPVSIFYATATKGFRLIDVTRCSQLTFSISPFFVGTFHVNGSWVEQIRFVSS